MGIVLLLFLTIDDVEASTDKKGKEDDKVEVKADNKEEKSVLDKDVKELEVEDVDKEHEEVIKNMKKKDKEIAGLLIDIEDLEEEREGVIESLKVNKKEIKKVEKEIEKLEEEIELLEEDIEKRYEVMSGRLLAKQEQGDMGYLEVLLGSSSFKELVSRANSMSTILDADKNIVEDIEDAVTELDKMLKEVEEMRKDLKRIEEINKEQKEDLEKKIKKAEKAQKKLEKEIKKLDLSEKELKKLRKEVRVELGMKTVLSEDRLEWPTEGGYISSPFGYRIHPITGKRKLHSGTDIARTDRSKLPPVYAAEEGKVVRVSEGHSGGYGNMIVIQHKDGMETLYAHLNAIGVEQGQKVDRGEGIGIMGTTGNSTGVHLHFEVIVDGKHQEPMKYLKSEKKSKKDKKEREEKKKSKKKNKT